MFLSPLEPALLWVDCSFSLSLQIALSIYHLEQNRYGNNNFFTWPLMVRYFHSSMCAESAEQNRWNIWCWSAVEFDLTPTAHCDFRWTNLHHSSPTKCPATVYRRWGHVMWVIWLFINTPVHSVFAVTTNNRKSFFIGKHLCLIEKNPIHSFMLKQSDQFSNEFFSRTYDGNR